MLRLYISKPDDVIMCNDEFFVSNTYKELVKNPDILKEVVDIEGVSLSGTEIISKFTGEKLHLNRLSTGCKTLLNVLKFPNRVFFIGECGSDILKKLFEIEGVSLYAPSIYLPMENVKNDIIVYVNSRKLNFSDTDSLYDWWCNYES